MISLAIDVDESWSLAAEDERTGIQLRGAIRSDAGLVRRHNEDAAHMDCDGRFFIVADGMGGHAAGDVASAMTVDVVRRVLEIAALEAAPDEVAREHIAAVLKHAVRIAHQAVQRRALAESDKHGMGTTLDVVLIAGREAFVAHVGDGRTYLVRDGAATQLTCDQTAADLLVSMGQLSMAQALASPLRSTLVNWIGAPGDVGVELVHILLQRDDRLLLCSDGLHAYFTGEELAAQLSSDDPGEGLRALVELAKARGGHDNITGVVVDVLALGPQDGAVEAELSDAISDGVPVATEEDDDAPRFRQDGGYWHEQRP